MHRNSKIVSKKFFACLPVFFVLLLAQMAFISSAQNPIIRNQFSADPSARVFGDRVFLFPSHDIRDTTGKGRPNWFCMEDYHVFSSDNLTQWKDHGMIITQNNIPWVKRDSYSMWAPDCIERNGKYYFYYPTTPADTTTYGRGFTIGVAIASKPEGPYLPQPTPIAGVHGIDPNVFIDKDGQAYLYFSAGNIFVARLKSNMLELDSEVKTIENLPVKGLKEGPYLFEKDGRYYLTYPHVENKTERLEYAVGNNPMGPFTRTGVIMDESPSGCWTNHHSIINFKNQWYLFYHDRDYSPNFDKTRSVRADSLFFNSDGTIKQVQRSLRGIGITQATEKIEIDRFSEKSDEGSTVSLLDTNNTFLGWKTHFSTPGSWMQYNTVNFNPGLKNVVVRAKSSSSAKLLLKTVSGSKNILQQINIPKSADWVLIKTKLKTSPAGLNNIILQLQAAGGLDVDWISFK